MSSSFTQAQLDALEAAIAQGARRVRYADKEVEYASMDDMIKARNLMRKELGIVKPGNRTILHTTSKGTDTCGGSSDNE